MYFLQIGGLHPGAPSSVLGPRRETEAGKT
jgi:hypothetical protein